MTQTSTRFTPFELGAAQAQELLPQRPPLLLVEDIVGLGEGARPALRARYTIRGDEPVLQGHFPGRPLWPGTYTIEGLAQSCALLGALVAHPALQKRLPTSWSAAVPTGGRGLLARADVKLTHPVVPPAELIYEVCLTHVVGALCRFEVEALVGRESVARGTLTVALAADAGSSHE